MAQAVYDGLALLLRKRRADAQLSQLEVAGLAGLTRSAIANIEAGRQGVLLHHVYALARALKCQPHELLPDMPLYEDPQSDAPRAVELFVASLSGRSARAPRT
jgi:transcriptional regulator with XRE-family HTH domain